jgi:hypothetical protein
MNGGIMKMQLTKIPSIVRRLHLLNDVEVGVSMVPEEGAVLVVEALADEGKNNVLEFTSGRIGTLVEGDILPVVLGKRLALREYSGDIPAYLDVGDTLFLLCESGIVGEMRGRNEAYGAPMQVRVLGGVVAEGKHLNIKDAAIKRQECLTTSAPIVGVVGTCMSIGKTTAICKLIKHFRHLGLKVASVKLTGVASTQDLDTVHDAGADPALSFMDGGLPSTCGNPREVLEVALGLLHEANTGQPDLIIAEFGDSILGEYHVEHLLRHPDIQRQICSFIVATGDFVAAWGAKELLHQYGIPITAITGPVANNESGAFYVEKHLHIPAESNQHEMLKIIRLVEERVQRT